MHCSTEPLNCTSFLCSRVEGVLAVSRAFGDRRLKRYVTCEPDICEHVIQPEDEFLVLATDGLWDVVSTNRRSSTMKRQQWSSVGVASQMCSSSCILSHVCSFFQESNQDVADAILRCISAGGDLHKAAENVAEAAVRHGSGDNITIMIVDLRPKKGSGSTPCQSANG